MQMVPTGYHKRLDWPQILIFQVGVLEQIPKDSEGQLLSTNKLLNTI